MALLLADRRPWPDRLWLAATGLAMGCMLVFWAEHLLARTLLPGLDLCTLGAGWSCREAASHPWARIGPLPAAAWAAIIHASLFSLGPRSWADRNSHRWAGLLVGLLVVASLAFLVVMLRDLSSRCPLCLTAHGCHLVLLAILLANPRPRGLLLSRPEAAGRPWRPALALLVLALGLAAWSSDVAGQRQLTAALASPRLLAPILQGEIDRHYLAAPWQRIAGPAQGQQELTIVGSLACRHCRQLLAQVPALPLPLRDRIAIFFVPFPLAPACNPAATGDPQPERCLLAEKTRAAQEEGRFWPWLAEVDEAPGRILRRLAAQPPAGRPWSPALTAQIAAANEVPVPAIPLLLWNGQKLPPALATVPLADLLPALLAVEEDKLKDAPPVDPCDQC
ncbi:MAG: vitamin K epoxide reductase family protein [Thermodesulfobacteriota bacterium]